MPISEKICQWFKNSRFPKDVSQLNCKHRIRKRGKFTAKKRWPLSCPSYTMRFSHCDQNRLLCVTHRQRGNLHVHGVPKYMYFRHSQETKDSRVVWAKVIRHYWANWYVHIYCEYIRTLRSWVMAWMLDLNDLFSGSFSAETLPLLWEKKITPKTCIAIMGENSSMAWLKPWEANKLVVGTGYMNIPRQNPTIVAPLAKLSFSPSKWYMGMATQAERTKDSPKPTKEWPQLVHRSLAIIYIYI